MVTSTADIILPSSAELFDFFSENDFRDFLLHRHRERDERDVARLLDRLRQPALVRGAHARNAARRDLAALGNEGSEQPHVLVVDVVDPIDAEPAYFLAPEIL